MRMSESSSNNTPAPSLSVIVPAYQAGEDLPHCLAALRKDGGDQLEIIVVDDASPGQDMAEIAAAHGAKYLRLERNGGPAVARNAGVAASQGELLMFVDADCVVHPGTLAKARAAFTEESLGACFGSYDEQPAAAGFLSQYRNLYHRWVHQNSPTKVSTFWTGCGAVTRAAFEQARGFNPQLSHMGMEDIELGYRISDLDLKIAIVKDMLCQHRKRWTLSGMVRTDIFHRGVPWMLILMARDGSEQDLNINHKARVATLAGGLFPALLLLTLVWPWFALPAALCGLIMVLMQSGFYRYLRKIRGPLFALRAIPAQWLFFLCCAVSIPLAVARKLRGKGLKPR